jgi:hypothetical protein
MWIMLLSSVLLFGVAFVSEMCAVGYTLAVARNKQMMAAIFSGAIALLNAGILLSIVSDHGLLAPSILGEVAGTVAMLRLGNRGSSPVPE